MGRSYQAYISLTRGGTGPPVFTVKLSIPVDTGAVEFLSGLLPELMRQADGPPVDILVFWDNKKRTTGAKLNALIEIAQGEYVSIVVDDDWVEPQYVQAILETIDRNR